jgi:hypothetical protein
VGPWQRFQMQFCMRRMLSLIKILSLCTISTLIFLRLTFSSLFLLLLLAPPPAHLCTILYSIQVPFYLFVNCLLGDTWLCWWHLKSRLFSLLLRTAKGESQSSSEPSRRIWTNSSDTGHQTEKA